MAVTATDLGKTLDTRERILGATFAAIEDFGITRLTVEDVAQRAGLSRQTVYRYFPSKDHLVVALVAREEERFLDGVRRAFEENRDLREAHAESVRFVLRYAHEHPLLDRLIATDQAAFLPYVTTRALPHIVGAREAMVSLIRDRVPHVDEELVRTIVDITTRAIVSYMITPSDRSPDEIAEAMATVLERIVNTGNRDRTKEGQA